MSLTIQEVQQGIEHTIDLIHRLRSTQTHDIEFDIVAGTLVTTKPRTLLGRLMRRAEAPQRASFHITTTYREVNGNKYVSTCYLDSPLDAVKIQSGVYEKCVEWLDWFWSEELSIPLSQAKKVRKVIDSVPNTGKLYFRLDPVKVPLGNYIRLRSYDITTDLIVHCTYHLPLFFIRDYKKFLWEHRTQPLERNLTSIAPTN